MERQTHKVQHLGRKGDYLLTSYKEIDSGGRTNLVFGLDGIKRRGPGPQLYLLYFHSAPTLLFENRFSYSSTPARPIPPDYWAAYRSGPLTIALIPWLPIRRKPNHCFIYWESENPTMAFNFLPVHYISPTGSI